MRIVKFILVLMVLSSTVVYGQSKTTYQYIRNWPAGYDTTGVEWVVYNLYAAETKMLDKDSIDSYTAYNEALNLGGWRCNLGNFQGTPPPWQPGDTIVALGSIDTAYVANPGTYGNRIDHTGYYWLYSDTVTSTTPELITPDDTIRVIPKPIVTKTGPGGGANDTIWVTIPNPRETRDAGQTDYDVLGYWIVADSTGTGTPNAYADAKAIEIDFISVQGVYGDTTEFYMLESDSFAPWDVYDVYFAYKIVARPDTVAGYFRNAPGYCTYYFSQNSDVIQVYQNVIGIEEQKAPEPKTELQYVFPNPFRHSAKIAYALATAAYVELKVYDAAGQLVRTVINGAQSAGGHVVEFDGVLLPSGVYFYWLEAGEKKFSGRLVKLE